MDNDTNDPSAASACAGKTCNGFNYCFWAKFLAAIAALPLVAAFPSLFFTSWPVRIVLGAVAVAAAVYLAIWIDRRPALQKMVRPKR